MAALEHVRCLLWALRRLGSDPQGDPVEENGLQMQRLDSILPPDQPHPVQQKEGDSGPEVSRDMISPIVAVAMVICISVATMLVIYCLFARSGYSKWTRQRHAFKWVTAPVEPGGAPCVAIRVWQPESTVSALQAVPPKAKVPTAACDMDMSRKAQAFSAHAPAPPKRSPPLLPQGACFGESPEARPGLGVPCPPEHAPPILPTRIRRSCSMDSGLPLLYREELDCADKANSCYAPDHRCESSSFSQSLSVRSSVQQEAALALLTPPQKTPWKNRGLPHRRPASVS